MLHQKFSQKLLQKLSPQQIQLMKLLQIPTASLEQRIKDELESNPALEEGFEDQEDKEQEEVADKDEIDVSDYLSDDDDIAAYKLRSGNYSNVDEEDKTMPAPVIKSFYEHLMSQLGMLEIDDRAYEIAEQLIGSIGENGYLRRELDAIVDDLAFAKNITTTVKELEEVLSLIQNFDPPGIGAKDLQDSLLIQLSRLNKEDKDIKLARIIVANHFNEFAKKHYEKLIKQLGVSDEELKAAIEIIVSLNPKPASGYSEDNKASEYVVPDFTILNDNGELSITLNARNAPDLIVSGSYKEMLETYAADKKKDKEQKQAVMFIKQKIDSAKWFIDAIKQRQNTLLSSMYAIADYQEAFLLSGDETDLKPMILKDIAEKTNLDISTISRVSNSKYVQTEFGTFPLKFFFSESMQTDSGEEVSTKEVKKILEGFVADEDKKKPFSDEKLMEMLKDKGYNIARRTVAKYREQLNIPVARMRKEL